MLKFIRRSSLVAAAGSGLVMLSACAADSTDTGTTTPETTEAAGAKGAASNDEASASREAASLRVPTTALSDSHSGSSGGGCNGCGGGGDGPDLDLDVDLDICAAVWAVAKASTEITSCTIGGLELPLASGTKLVGEALLALGAKVCLHAHVNVSGELEPPSNVSLDLLGKARAKVCGTVKAYVAASLETEGLLTIGSVPLVLAPGLDIDAALAVGAKVCVDVDLDIEGRVDACLVSPH